MTTVAMAVMEGTIIRRMIRIVEIVEVVTIE